jgi:hypothetical protein
LKSKIDLLSKNLKNWEYTLLQLGEQSCTI